MEHRHTVRAWMVGLGMLGAGLLWPGSALAQEQLDWCAPVVISPEQRWWATSTCEPWWKPQTIASRADYVVTGFLVPSQQILPPDPAVCFGAQTQANLKAYHDDLHARAAGLGRTLTILYNERFDLVLRQLAALPGFDASFLVPARDPLETSTRFFSRDLSPNCVCGCAWSEEPGPTSVPAGQRLSDLVDVSGGEGTYATKVQYAIRPGSNGVVDGVPRRFFGSSLLADQRNPAYRAWRVAEAQAVLIAGGYDGVMLNHKLHQYFPTNPSPWWGGSQAVDVSGYFATNDTLWSSPPEGYGFPEYVEGWAALAADLTEGNVPYAVIMKPFLWSSGNTFWNDPSTPLFDERVSIRQVAHGASVIFLDLQGGGGGDLATAQAQIAAASLARVVVINSGCGDGPVDQPVTPSPVLSAQVVVSPDAGALQQFSGQSITVRPGGSSTGPWTGEFWCHCPSGFCGTPDATVLDSTATSWSVPASTCDVRWNGATGVWRPRARITRAGFTAQSLDTINVCTPQCRNGIDDDGDGDIDHGEDPACTTPDQPYETARCENGRDDDGDGLVDLEDPGCFGQPYGASESPTTPACGLLGIESLIGLAAAARRWRRAPQEFANRQPLQASPPSTARTAPVT